MYLTWSSKPLNIPINLCASYTSQINMLRNNTKEYFKLDAKGLMGKIIAMLDFYSLVQTLDLLLYSHIKSKLQISLFISLKCKHNLNELDQKKCLEQLNYFFNLNS